MIECQPLRAAYRLRFNFNDHVVNEQTVKPYAGEYTKPLRVSVVDLLMPDEGAQDRGAR